MTPADQQDRPEQPDRADAAAPDAVEPEAPPAGTEPDVAAVDDETGTEPEWARRRRLDAVFGDGAHGQALGDRYYRDQVPPHHG